MCLESSYTYTCTYMYNVIKLVLSPNTKYDKSWDTSVCNPAGGETLYMYCEGPCTCIRGKPNLQHFHVP